MFHDPGDSDVVRGKGWKKLSGMAFPFILPEGGTFFLEFHASSMLACINYRKGCRIPVIDV